ncbi:cytochrome b [Paenirhodobacter sp.]|uniref:cytochrome b n=1 Tax=Paenirhodobacter sp. TaxID=1965326 RepID=UPI003B3F1E8B
MTLFVLIVLRLIWAVANRRQRPAHGAGLQGLAARLGHLALYLLMLVVPGVALLRAWGSERAFALFSVAIFPARAEAVEWTVALAGALHGELSWVMAVLILGHVVMVGLHQAMWRDGTLSRMAGPPRKA